MAGLAETTTGIAMTPRRPPPGKRSKNAFSRPVWLAV
jgi:hypothetical protein